MEDEIRLTWHHAQHKHYGPEAHFCAVLFYILRQPVVQSIVSISSVQSSDEVEALFLYNTHTCPRVHTCIHTCKHMYMHAHTHNICLKLLGNSNMPTGIRLLSHS